MYGSTPLQRLAAVAALGVLAPAVSAAPIGYTSAADFQAAVAGLSGVATSTLDFEANTAGDTFSLPTSFDGLGLDYAAGAPSLGLQLVVDNVYSTTSGNNYLGTLDGADQTFVDGDGLSFSFSSAVQAIGLYVIGSPGDLLAGDLLLGAGGTSLFNATADRVLADGGEAFFLGLVDTAGGFTSASFSSLQVNPGDITYLFNIDDITTAAVTAVPEPSPALLALIGGLALLRLRARPSQWRTEA